MSTSWEEGRGAPLDAHPLRCNPVELGVYPKRSAAYQTLSEEDEADRAREIEEGLASARASAAAEIRKIQERKARKFTTVENDKPTNDTVESVADQPKSTAKIQDAGDGAFDEIHVDIEAHPTKVAYRNSYEPEVVVADDLVAEIAWLQWLRKLELALNMKLGIEIKGATRITEISKDTPHNWNVFFMWITVTCHAGTIPIGLLGVEFGLSFYQCIAAIVVGNILGALCTAFCGTLGPKVRYFRALGKGFTNIT